jgi:DeoR/GlpR family transcriptional regulator of sugar metabolism
MSVGAIDPDGTMLEFDLNEVAIMRIMMANAKQVYVAADHTKFHASVSVKLASTAEIDALFTDAAPPVPLAALLQQQQVELNVVPGGSGSRAAPAAAEPLEARPAVLSEP